MVKVRGPEPAELDLLHEGETLISFFWPAQNPELLEQAKAKGVAIAMDMVPGSAARRRWTLCLLWRISPATAR